MIWTGLPEHFSLKTASLPQTLDMPPHFSLWFTYLLLTQILKNNIFGDVPLLKVYVGGEREVVYFPGT